MNVRYQLPYNNPTLWDGFGSTAYPRTNPHRGLDFPGARGSTFGSIAFGIIARNAYSSVLGYYVVVQHADGKYSGYCHSDQPSVWNVGDFVGRGQIINLRGNSGSATTGPHLHLTLSNEVGGVTSGHVEDPYPYIMARTEGRDDQTVEENPYEDPSTAVPATRAWTANESLRPRVNIISNSGKVKVTITAYGKNALVTYSIPGVRSRDEAIASTAATTAELRLTSFSEGSTSRSWIVNVPAGLQHTIYTECFGLNPEAFVASPSIIAEVVA